MIHYTEGNLLDAEAEALVNTVNEVGVMGKGIALMFREAFPKNMEVYEAACKSGGVRVGRMLTTENHALVGPRWIINFPTKKHWRNPSKLEWIQDGLRDLAAVIQELGIVSIALPPLGCGQGGLQWADVRYEIERAFAPLDGVDILVFAPTRVYQNTPKQEGVEILTPARALIAELVRRYSGVGLDCTNLEIQKLAWFLQRVIAAYQLPDLLKLTFQPNKFGPYADGLRHLLNSLDGSYLHGTKRLADAGPLDLIHFDDAKRADVEAYLTHSATEFLPALESTSKIIDGFESPLGMELLATVDWLLVCADCAPTIGGLLAGLSAWPGGPDAADRKRRIFDSRLLALALERLTTSEVLGNRRR